MKELKDIRDDQIRVIGEEVRERPRHRTLWVVATIILLVSVAMVAMLAWPSVQVENVPEEVVPEPALFEPETIIEPVLHQRMGCDTDSLELGYTEIVDTVINDVVLRLYIPHNAEMSLHIGKIDIEDTSIIYAAQAADVRADNGGIVGAFVLKGEPKAWGLSKKGFCASINGEVTVGVAENSPLFEKATEEGGYFFRQYPLVSNGKLVENEPKGKSIRRAICDRNGEIFMVETGTAESFHDFAQALADLGVGEAVYLVGSSAYGWAVDENGDRHEFGVDHYYTGRRKAPKNISYMVWKKR